MEKWMKSRVTRRPIHLSASPGKSFGKSKKAYYGMPSQLFKDSDKDGVPDVFDCKPYNKKKQDVVAPLNFGGGYMDMYQRQENARLQKLYAAQQAAQLEELRRLQTPVTNVYETTYPTSYITTGGSGGSSPGGNVSTSVASTKTTSTTGSKTGTGINGVISPPLMSVPKYNYTQPVVVIPKANILAPVSKPSFLSRVGTAIAGIIRKPSVTIKKY